MAEKIKDRIAKLIAKAEGTDNEEESATFMAAAVKMMARHDLDEAEIRARMGKDALAPGIVVVEWTIPCEDGLAQVRSGAGTAILDEFGCHAVTETHLARTDGRWALKIYGTQSAADSGLTVLRSLSVQWEAAAAKAWDAKVAAERATAEMRERERQAHMYGGWQEWSLPPIRPIPQPQGYPSYDYPNGYGMPVAGGWQDQYHDPYAAPVLTPAQQEAEQLIKICGIPQHTADEIRRNLGIPTQVEQAARQLDRDLLYGRRSPAQRQPDVQAQRKTFMVSFITGFAHRAAARLKAARAEAVAESPGAGLVLVADSARAKAKMDEDFPNLKEMTSSAVDWTAFAAGSAAGAGADLGGTRMSWDGLGPRGIGA